MMSQSLIGDVCQSFSFSLISYAAELCTNNENEVNERVQYKTLRKRAKKWYKLYQLIEAFKRQSGCTFWQLCSLVVYYFDDICSDFDTNIVCSDVTLILVLRILIGLSLKV